MAERCCGHREGGGIYIEIQPTLRGRPITDFIVDPPFLIPKDWKLVNRGMTPKPRKDSQTGEIIIHLFDVVGKSAYLNVADFIEEARTLGISRRVSPKLPFSTLHPKHSRLFLVHALGYINHLEDYQYWECPYGYDQHQPQNYHSGDPNSMCAGAYWRDIRGGQDVSPDSQNLEVIRHLPGTSYRGYKSPKEVGQRFSGEENWYSRYQQAVFMAIPIQQLSVVRSASAKFENNLAIAKRSPFDVVEVDA